MNIRPEQIQLVKQWICKAEEDLKNAEYTLTLREDCPLSTVCFHSQQCAEKYIKALLIYCSVEFPKSHDLVELVNLIPHKYKPDMAVDDLAIINRYAVDACYPGDWEIVTRQEAEESVVIAKEVRRRIRIVLPNEVLDS